MAITRLQIDGYGQLELNQVAFRRDGRIEAQCKLDETDFASIPCENGMILAVDNVNKVVKLPASGTEDYPLALVYTTEHLYDERAIRLSDFKLTINDGFYPRLGYLSIGDKFMTNTICYDSSDFAATSTKTVEEVIADAYADIKTTPLYGQVDASGVIQITDTKPQSGLTLLAINGPGVNTMPDGQLGFKFQVIGL
ncbi:MAG: hypothetical protein IKU01_01685 [Bacteroidales bacterium]|nr:hypothetical protein [Bacteroidales bacterium]